MASTDSQPGGERGDPAIGGQPTETSAPTARRSGNAPRLTVEALGRASAAVHESSEHAWLYTAAVPLRVFLFPAHGQHETVVITAGNDRARASALLRPIAARLQAVAILITGHIAYSDAATGLPPEVAARLPVEDLPAPEDDPNRGEGIITAVCWPGQDLAGCWISDVHADDHGVRLLPPRDAWPDPPPLTGPIADPLAAWLVGLLPGHDDADTGT